MAQASVLLRVEKKGSGFTRKQTFPLSEKGHLQPCLAAIRGRDLEQIFPLSCAVHDTDDLRPLVDLAVQNQVVAGW